VSCYTTLSGGQRQRLIIARAPARRPAYILVDEATSALDNRTQAIISSSLEHIGCTRVVIANKASRARNPNMLTKLNIKSVPFSRAFTHIRDFYWDIYTAMRLFSHTLTYACLLTSCATLTSSASLAQSDETLTFQTLSGTRVAKAQPQSCFEGVGIDPENLAPPCGDAQPKVDQAYIWGLTVANEKAFFGTVANTHCLVIGSFLQSLDPAITPDYVCEFGSSPLVRNGIPGVLNPGDLPAAIGDFRPPQLYSYDADSKVLDNLGETLPATAAGLLATTLGIRAAGSLDGVVLFAGPALNPASGINLFAFDSSGAFLGATQLPDYNNIRKFLVVEGKLYAGVGTYGSESTGRVLRWRGSVNSPFDFDEVGILPSTVAELAEHEDRIFVTTWPDIVGSAEAVAGLYMSPTIPQDGLPEVGADAASWQEIWSVSDYEADPITRQTYGGGALASYGDYLYWGTMHVPSLSTLLHGAACENAGKSCTDNSEPQELFLNSERGISIFRARNLTTAPDVELLYGYDSMPVFDPQDGSWDTVQNLLGEPPLFGTAGFNNPLNNYTWTMQVFDDRLFVGTMDWTSLLLAGIGDDVIDSGNPLIDTLLSATANLLAGTLTGADLWYFPTPEGPALPETLDGVGNSANYGIRTMVAADEQLYIGTANPMNLLTDPDSPDQGGWELIALSALPDNTPAGKNVSVDLPDGATVRFCDVTSAGSTRLVSVADIAGLDDFREAQTLAAAAGLPVGSGDIPSLPNGGSLQNVLSVVSSSDWRSAECAAPATLTLPLSRAYYEPRLLQLSVDPQDGSVQFEDITLQRSLGGQGVSQGRANTMTAGITSGYVGVLLLVEGVAPVPFLPLPALLLLVCGLALAGTARLKVSRKETH
jgi:hypothetical protein